MSTTDIVDDDDEEQTDEEGLPTWGSSDESDSVDSDEISNENEDLVSRKRAEAKQLVKSYEKDLNMDLLDKAIDLLTDPIHGSPSKNQRACVEFYVSMSTTCSWPVIRNSWSVWLKL